jgi:hypothetical protein
MRTGSFYVIMMKLKDLLMPAKELKTPGIYN